MSEIKEREKEGGGDTTTDNYEDYDNDDDQGNHAEEVEGFGQAEGDDQLNQVDIGIPANPETAAASSSAHVNNRGDPQKGKGQLGMQSSQRASKSNASSKTQSKNDLELMEIYKTNLKIDLRKNSSNQVVVGPSGSGPQGWNQGQMHNAEETRFGVPSSNNAS